MKRRIAAKSTRIQPVRLHLEDVTELVRIFQQYCKSVEISDDKAVYDSLSEASNNASGTIANLEIVGTDPNVTLSLKRTGSWLNQKFDKPSMTPEEIDRHDILYFRVKDFLAERRTAGSYLFGVSTPLIMVALVIGIFEIGRRIPGVYQVFAMGAGWLVLCVWIATVQVFGRNIGSVSLKPKSESSTFWSRNKDKIGLLLLGAAISEAINLLAHHTSK